MTTLVYLLAGALVFIGFITNAVISLIVGIVITLVAMFLLHYSQLKSKAEEA